MSDFYLTNEIEIAGFPVDEMIVLINRAKIEYSNNFLVVFFISNTQSRSYEIEEGVLYKLVLSQ